jgi:hypothetical protein
MPSIAPPPPDHRPREYEPIDDLFNMGTQPIFLREAESIKRSWSSSQLLTNLAKIDGWMKSLPSMKSIEPHWNVEQSPVPNDIAVNGAMNILEAIRLSSALPEKVQPSAEGGVAIVYVGAGINRAIIEALNNNETYVLFYDTNGHAVTVDWPNQNRDAQREIVTKLETFLRGAELATIR